MIDLTSYPSIQSNIFVKIVVDEYRLSPLDPYTSTTLLFSDRQESYELNGDTYVGLGRLMSITDTTSQIRATSSDLSIGISGIPNDSIYEIVNSKIKGCAVTVYRVLFDPVTNTALNITGNPLARYRGFVNNYTLQEDWNQDTRTSSNTIVLVCASALDVLSNKVSGRKTNPYSEKKYFPNDVSMDRVPSLENATFDFGKTD